jgi:hypothetical protein
MDIIHRWSNKIKNKVESKKGNIQRVELFLNKRQESNLKTLTDP